MITKTLLSEIMLKSEDIKLSTYIVCIKQFTIALFANDIDRNSTFAKSKKNEVIYQYDYIMFFSQVYYATI